MERLNNFFFRANWFMLGATFAFILMLFIATRADADEALPKGLPVKSIITLCDEKGPAGEYQILFVEAEYADGTIIRFDEHHTYGFAGTDLYSLMQKAAKHATRTIHCPKATQS